ncbi:MAG: peptide chain release factor N(5)-glutamine methyltransferase [Clostridia bacterium]|nr:peptide chain release factor N(5)-glutamine methyltransferase [Clostridia bacterium]
MIIRKAYEYAKVYLKNIENAEPVFEAKQIIMHITGLNASEILSQYANELSEEQFDALCDILYRRKSGEPLQYIFGEWEFYGLNFKVGQGVLIPRADTEILCEKAIEHIADKPLRVIDLCSGSGCIALAVASKCKNASVFALEKETEAYKYLLENIKNLNLNVTPVLDDVFSFKSEEKFDVILSNPPYIKSNDIPSLQKEVLSEPKTALDGGEDGLKFYKAIAAGAKERWLNENGKIFFEIGFDQAKDVSDVLKQNGFSNIKIINDYNGLNRVVEATL